MKTPRRDFVVEYKSARRQTKPQSASIWGNLDLRAVARQVNADDVLPAEEPARSKPVGTQKVEASSPLNAVIHLANAPDGVDGCQPLAEANPEAVDAVPPPVPERTIDEVQPAGHAAISSPRTRKRKSAGLAPSRPTRRSSQSPDARNAFLPFVDLDDDIAMLDAENRHLKRLMADKLRSENKQLRSILGRLEKISVSRLA